MPELKEKYVPYGAEWEAQLHKYPKPFIIGILKDALLEKADLLEALQTLLNVDSINVHEQFAAEQKAVAAIAKATE